MTWTVAWVLAVASGVAAASEASASDPVSDNPTDAGSLSAVLQEQRVFGFLRTDYFTGSKALDGKKDLLGTTAQVKASPTLSQTVDGKLELRVSDGNLSQHRAVKGDLLEGYLNVRLDTAALRLGKQIVAWGRADGINPTDNLTPRDYTVMLPFDDDQRFGTPAAKLDYFVSQAYTLTVFATPFFAPAKIPLPTTAGVGIQDAKPKAALRNSEFALKLNQVSDNFDWSVSAFHGFNLLPQLQLQLSGPTTATMALRYDRITIVGADFAKNFGRFGLRGELAYGRPGGESTAGADALKPYVSWIGGVDRTFFDNLNVNLQFFQRRVQNYQGVDAADTPAQRAVALQSAVINGQRDRVNNGVSFRISDKWLNDALEFEVFGVLNLTGQDHYVRPLITYAFTDHWKATVGAEIFSGPATTQFGGLKSSHGGFAEVRYGF